MIVLPDDIPASGIITDLKPVMRNPSRVSIFVEEIYIGTISTSRLNDLNLTVGSELSETDLEILLEETEITKATLSSLNLLSYRARSEDEIRSRLKRKGFSSPVVDRVIEKLNSWDYLDDKEFARSWVKHRTKRKSPYGSKYIRYELNMKGVDKEIIDEVLEDVDDHTLCDKSAKVAHKRYEKKYEGIKLREHLYAHLVRRGFPSPVVVDVIEEILSEE